MGREIPKGLDGYPFSYNKEIKLRQGKNYIELLFGQDSMEHLRINNDNTRQEIFDHLKNNIPGAVFSHQEITALKAGKKPLIAFVVVLILFLWTLYIAIGIDNGNEYDVTGKLYNSIAGIVVAIAGMGVGNVVLLFGSLLAIALISFVRKAKHPPVIDKLILR